MSQIGANVLRFDAAQRSVKEMSLKLIQLEREAFRYPLDVMEEFVAIVLLRLASEIGLRGVVDPLCFLPVSVDRRLGIVLVEDKASTEAHRVRLAAVSQGFFHWLDLLRRYYPILALSIHRRSIRSNLPGKLVALASDELTRKNQPIPFFGFISREYDWLSITPTIHKQVLGERWPYRICDTRQVLATWLAEHNVPEFLYETQMGHYQLTDLPFGKNRAWTPHEFSIAMQPHLSTYMKELGWSQ